MEIYETRHDATFTFQNYDIQIIKIYNKRYKYSGTLSFRDNTKEINRWINKNTLSVDSYHNQCIG